MGFMKKALKITALAGASYGGFKAYKKYKELKENYDQVYFFKSKQNEVVEEEYEGGSYACTCAVLELDLSEAIIEYDITIDLYGLCSVASITIPDGCNVKVEGIGKRVVVQNEFEVEEAETEEEEIEQIVDVLEEKPVITIKYKMSNAVLEIKEKSEEEAEEETEQAEVEVEAVEVEEVNEDGIKVDATVNADTVVEDEEAPQE